MNYSQPRLSELFSVFAPLLYTLFLFRNEIFLTPFLARLHPLLPLIVAYLVRVHFLCTFAAVHFALRQNFDTYLFILTFRVDAAITRNRLLRIARRVWVRFSIQATALCITLISAPRTTVFELGRICAIALGSEHYVLVETSVAMLAASTALTLLQRFEIWRPTLSSHSKPLTKAFIGSYVTTLGDIIGKGDNSLFENATWGLSALINAEEDDPCPDQVAMATSEFGHFMDGTRAAMSIVSEAPVFCVSYIHANHEADRLDKMRPEDWQSVNCFARYMARSGRGSRYYMLWFDGVIRFRKQQRRNIPGVTWMYYGLLPYTLFHTIATKTDDEESMTRVWPAMERVLATLVGKLYVSNGTDGFGMSEDKKHMSPSSAIRVAGLWPQLHEGQLRTYEAYDEHARMLRALVRRFALGNYDIVDRTAQNGVLTSPAAQPVRVEEQTRRRLSVEALWLATQHFGIIFDFDKIRGFTMGDPRRVNGLYIDPLLDAIRGGVPGIPRQEKLCVSDFDKSLQLSYSLNGFSRDESGRPRLFQIACGIRTWGIWKAKALPIMIEVERDRNNTTALSVRPCRPELVKLGRLCVDNVNVMLRVIYEKWDYSRVEEEGT